MKFQWYEANAWGSSAPMWQLHMVKSDAHGCEQTVSILGTLTKLNRAWRIMERKTYVKPDMYWLDGDLSLEDAQRAAKLFLCVGRSNGATEGRRA